MNDRRGDEDLMLAYVEGDMRAFEELYGRHKGAIYRYILRQCGNAADAQELFQDVWMNIIRARERYRPRARFGTYLFHLAHNRLVDYYRRQAHNPTSARAREPLDPDDSEPENANPHPAPADGPDDALHRRRLGVRLLELLADLPAPQREAFLLREEAGLSVDEIAEVTGVNAETAKSRLRYAVRKLRRALAPELIR